MSLCRPTWKLLTASQVWYNKCNGGGAGDDDTTNPDLPTYQPGGGLGTCPSEDLDLCTLLPGHCDQDEPEEPSDESVRRSARLDGLRLMPRGSNEEHIVPIGPNDLSMRIIFLAFPLLRVMLRTLYLEDPNSILLRFWRFLTRGK